jgi:GntR family transcriptional regulator
LHIIISNSSPDPIYEQVSKQIKALILMGELSPGEALPSIRSLARELQISVITSKRAYEELEREGFVETVPGRGSFVAQQNQELLRERRMRAVEEKLTDLIKESQMLGVSLEELHKMLDLLYKEV